MTIMKNTKPKDFEKIIKEEKKRLGKIRDELVKRKEFLDSIIDEAQTLSESVEYAVGELSQYV
jgi:hypothetical protein